MVARSTHSFHQRLTETNEFDNSLVVVHSSIPDPSLSPTLQQVDVDCPGRLTHHDKLQALTPEYASSLYWFI